MFTGIVQGRGQIAAVEDQPGLRRLRVQLPEGRGAGLQIGASVSIDGVCLTAVAFDGDAVDFDLIAETLARTSLGSLVLGAAVNIERAARLGDELGGHLLSGHVSATAPLVARIDDENNVELQFLAPVELRPYLFEKGYVGLDGCSLTLGRVLDDGRFSVHLIPETLRVTTLGQKAIGARVNVEADAMTVAVVQTTEATLARRLGGGA